MLFASIALYQNGEVGFDGVLIPTVALMSSFGPTVALANLGSTLQNTFAAGNRVLDILEETPIVAEVTGRTDITFAGAAAESVRFAYGQETILDNVSVDVPENQIVGIVGRSGSGKSTLLKLFMRFWEVREGKVSLSGRAVGDINTANLRDMESLVTQQTHLFHGSIRSNLRIAKLAATDEEIVAACKKASVHDFIMTLPQGYDTPVGELGDTLSGGERQRLGLARAFLHDAPFLLLVTFCFGKSSEKLHNWFIGTKLYKDNLESYVQGKGMTKKTKVRVMVTVTLLMSVGFVMMRRVAVGRIVLVCVWLFHIVYFLFGVRTLKPEQMPEAASV